VSSRAATPYQGVVDADPKGTAGEARFGTHISWLQRPAGCRYPIPIESRPPESNRTARLTGAGSRPRATAECPRWDSDPHCPAPHAGASCQLGYEDPEPPPGADPGLLPYGSRAAAVRGGVAGESGFEPELNGPEPIVLPGYTIPHGCERRDSDPHGPYGPPGLEPGVATVTPLPPGRPNTPCVRRERLERSPRRLRVCCSGH
jgi:hypothetical protein